MMKWIKENDVILRVTSLVIAILLWSYVMSTDDPEKDDYFTVPIQIQGISELNNRELVIMSGGDTKVTMKATGQLSKLQALKENYELTLNPTASVSNITAPGEYELAYAPLNPPEGLTFTDGNPAKVTIVVDKMSTISVPVEVELTGVLSTGLVLSKSHVAPDAIPVRGPESILSQIRAAKVVYDVSGLTDSIQTNVSYQLLDREGKEVRHNFLSTDTPSVTLDFTLKKNDSVDLTVEFVETPYLTSDMISYEIDPESLKLEGSLEAMQDLNQIRLSSIYLRDVVEDGETAFERMILLPNGVTAKDAPSRYATVTVTLKDGAWKTYTFEPSLLPGDPLFTYAEQSFEVEVFAANSVLSNLRPEDFILELVYDLDDLIAGENIITVKVSLNRDNVYIRGEGKVIASVSEEALIAAREPNEPVGPAEPDQPDEPSDT